MLASFSHAGTRVISLGSVVTETLQALDALDVIVAVDASSQLADPQPKLPRVGYYRMISTEGILSMRPDLVLGTEDAGPPHVIKQIRQTGVKVELITADKTLEGAITRILALGEKMNRTSEAKALAAPLQERLQHPPAALPSAPRVVFLYARGAGAPTVSGSGTGAAEMIRLAGAVNAVEGFAGYRPFTPEALVAARPDVVLVTTQGVAAMGGEEAVWALPGMGKTPAGSQKRIVVMDDAFLLNFGPRTVEALNHLRSSLTD